MIRAFLIGSLAVFLLGVAPDPVRAAPDVNTTSTRTRQTTSPSVFTPMLRFLTGPRSARSPRAAPPVVQDRQTGKATVPQVEPARIR